jgi:hypothetical protein
MIRFISYSDIDKAKWDSCIRSSVNGLVYAYAWYLDIVCKKWDAIVEDDYKSVMPLPRGEKYGFRYTYPAPFTQMLGLFSTSNMSTENVKSFLAKIPSKYRYIEMNLNTINRVTDAAYEIGEGVTHLIDMIRPYESIFSNYSTQTKRNLKKALASSLTVSKGVAPQKIITLYKENRGKKYSYSAAHYAMLNKLMQACVKRDVGQAWGVYNKERELCAGTFFLESNKRTIFLFSGANDKAYETQAMTFLINRYIEENVQRNLVFDFEGSMDKDLARFYKGFGSKEVHFMQLRKNNLPGPVKWLKELQFKKRASTKK